MSTDEPRSRTAEGRLLDAAMLRQRPRRWTASRLAREASFSAEAVRNILKGYRIVRQGETTPITPRAETLAALADALGNITSDQLAEIGRADAAAALAILQRERGQGDAHERLAQLRAELEELEVKVREGRA